MRLSQFIFTSLLLLSLSAFTLAQDEDTKPDEQKQETPEKTDEQKAIEKFDKAIKDLTLIPGPFPFYRKEDDILLLLDEAKIEKIFLVQATLNSGVGDTLQAGDPLNQDFNDAYLFRKHTEKDFQLIKPNLDYRYQANNPLAIASSRSFPEAILTNFTIVAHHPTKKQYLLNVTSLFTGRIQGVNELISLMMSPGYSYDSTNSGPDSIKGFESNSVVRMNIHYRKMSAGGGPSLLALLLGGGDPPFADERSLPLKITFNLWWHKDDGYQPRFADPRIGYFTTDYFDVAKLKEVDRTTKLINRFHLVKKDPNAELSEPVEPIVWYLDNSIPEEYKEGVTRGILFWNSAFEKIGFKNALVVKDAPTDENWDHADGRYNIVRWTMSESAAYAVAWFRTNPINGRIENAAVTVDANYPASTLLEYNEQVVGLSERKPWFQNEESQQNLQAKLDSILKSKNWHKSSCTHAQGLVDEAKLGLSVLRALDVEIDLQEYTNSMLADLVGHEVGHCLGLRHNFAGSTFNSMNQLGDSSVTQQRAVAASLMDYTPINIFAVLNGHGDYWNPKIGVYDYWAIEYGYKPSKTSAPELEKGMLDTIAMKSGLPGHLYLTDEDADGINPLAVRWDLGANSLDYLQLRKIADDRLKDYALNKATKHGDSYTRRNALLLRAIRSKYRTANMATRFVGGVEFRRHLKGDVGEKLTLKPVSPAQQRDAMKLLSEVISDVSLNIPQDVLYGLSSAPDAGGSTYNAPLRGYLGSQHRIVLAMLLSNDKLDGIAENMFKTTTGDKYTLVEHYKYLSNAVFSELGKTTAIPDLKRDGQRYYLAMLMNQVKMPDGGINEDARVLANRHISMLESKMKNQLKLKGFNDEMSRMHLEDMIERIKRFKDRSD